MSRFTSGGTNDAPTRRDEAWIAAQCKIEADRQAKAAVGQQAGGKSLFEALQANKAAKQEAFEEAARLKNQFRALDDDEAGFLESVLEAERKREEEVRRETADGVERFRKEREERERRERERESERGQAVEGAGEKSEENVGPADWSKMGPRKRKRAPGTANGAIKIKRTSSAADGQADGKGKEDVELAVGRSASNPEHAKSTVPDESSKRRSGTDVTPDVGNTTVMPKPSLGLDEYDDD